MCPRFSVRIAGQAGAFVYAPPGGGTIHIANSSIVENFMTYAVVYVRDHSSLTLLGTTFARQDGYLVLFAYGHGIKLAAEDVVIADHTSGSVAQTIYADSTWTRCTFLRNQGDDRHSGGGGLTFWDGVHTVEDSVFEENTKDGDEGGAMLIKGGASVTVERTIFHANTVLGGKSGGGVCVREASTVRFDYSTFSANVCVDQGSAAAVKSGSSVTFDGCEFNSNYVHAAHGSLNVDEASEVVVRNTKFSDNGALAAAPALGVHGASTLTIEDSLFVDNHAGTDSGVGQVTSASTLTCTRVVMKHNTAETAFSGALWIAGASTLSLIDSWCVVPDFIYFISIPG